MHLLTRVCIALACSLALLLPPGCDALERITGRTADQLAAEVQTEAQANMVADGIDPATATPQQWRDYLGAATIVLVRRELEASTPEADALERAIGLSFPELGIAWAIITGAYALFTGRGHDNLATILSPQHGGKDTAMAGSALLFGTRSPVRPQPKAIRTKPELVADGAVHLREG